MTPKTHNNRPKSLKAIELRTEKKTQSKTLTENKMNKVLYYEGKQAVIDILNFMLIKSKKFENTFKELIEIYEIPNELNLSWFYADCGFWDAAAYLLMTGRFARI